MTLSKNGLHGPLSMALRITGPIAVALVCLFLLAGHLEPGTFRTLPQILTQLPFLNILGALALTGLSFWAIGRYDALAHRHFQTGIPEHQARASGTIAVALSQTLGFGLFTGALVRWRMLPGLSPGDAMRLSGFVCVTFLMALACVCALACLILPAPQWAVLPAMLVLGALLVLLPGSAFLPGFAALRHRRVLPSLPAFGAVLLWTVIDVIAAAGVLYLLIPVNGLTFATFLPLFLLAFGAALLSSAPGGVGPFELTLMALLPQVAVADLLAGILAYRALYYGLPAVIGILALLHPFAVPVPHPTPTPRNRGSLPAEAGVLRQNGGHLAQLGDVDAAVWPTGQSLAALALPSAGITLTTLSALTLAAHRRTKVPLLYKCNGTSAVMARRAGWHVVRIAQEAVLNPSKFDLAARHCRGVRRKLRRAQQAGVVVSTPEHLPLEAMHRLDLAWQARNGPARGGTMGRFCPAYLGDQLVLLAHQGPRLVGFVSFHIHAQEYCLDLMRSADDMPDGTMHLLITSALEQAAKGKVARLSLAACPDFDPMVPAPLRHVTQHLSARAGAAGLRQFKNSFAPDWRPRYAAAPGKFALSLALLDIATEVHRPRPLPSSNVPHNEVEDYEVALSMAT